MINLNNVMTLEQIKEKIKHGDYNTLALVLGISSDAAKMRFKRNDPDATEVLIKIITMRENLIKEFQPEK